jgi:hypothetical protein
MASAVPRSGWREDSPHDCAVIVERATGRGPCKNLPRIYMNIWALSPWFQGSTDLRRSGGRVRGVFWLTGAAVLVVMDPIPLSAARIPLEAAPSTAFPLAAVRRRTQDTRGCRSRSRGSGVAALIGPNIDAHLNYCLWPRPITRIRAIRHRFSRWGSSSSKMFVVPRGVEHKPYCVELTSA